MAIWRTSNPTLNDRAFSAPAVLPSGEVMTMDGTVNKSLLSLALLSAAAYWAWNDPTFVGMMIPGAIGTVVIAVILAFKQSWAPYLAPVYAVAEGFILGTISRFMESAYPGIVGQAVMLTFGVFACLLVAYKSKWITVSDKFRSGLFAATAAIALFYFVTMILSLFHVSMPVISGNGPLSIGISVVVTAIAAMNLLIDFDFIEKAAQRGQSPKYMEWYAAFGLLVTLVWLYMEILRLLAKLNSRRD